MVEETRQKTISEIEKTKAELEAVAEFINKLKDAGKELIMVLVDSMSGKKLGEDVASFYESLKNKGLPEELVIKMTEEYFKKRLSTIPDIGSLIKQLTTVKSLEFSAKSKESGLDRVKEMKENKERDVEEE